MKPKSFNKATKARGPYEMTAALNYAVKRLSFDPSTYAGPPVPDEVRLYIMTWVIPTIRNAAAWSAGDACHFYTN